MLTEMAEHPLFKDVVDELLGEFKPHFLTATEKQRQRRLTRLEAQISLHIDDEPAVAETGLPPDALYVLGDEVELAAGVCE